MSIKIRPPCKQIKSLMKLVPKHFQDAEARYPISASADGSYPIKISFRGGSFDFSWSEENQFTLLGPDGTSISCLDEHGVLSALTEAKGIISDETFEVGACQSPAKLSSKKPNARLTGKAKTAATSKRTAAKTRPGSGIKKSDEPTAKQLEYAEAIAALLNVPLSWNGIKPTRAMITLFIDFYKDRFDQKRRELKERRLEGSYTWLQTEALKEGL